jgi:hypothetical protein
MLEEANCRVLRQRSAIYSEKQKPLHTCYGSTPNNQNNQEKSRTRAQVKRTITRDDRVTPLGEHIELVEHRCGVCVTLNGVPVVRGVETA